MVVQLSANNIEPLAQLAMSQTDRVYIEGRFRSFIEVNEQQPPHLHISPFFRVVNRICDRNLDGAQVLGVCVARCCHRTERFPKGKPSAETKTRTEWDQQHESRNHIFEE